MIELPKPSGGEIVYRVVAKFCIIGFAASLVVLIIHLVMSRTGIPTESQNTGFSIYLLYGSM
jgi:hypothetical protein